EGWMSPPPIRMIPSSRLAMSVKTRLSVVMEISIGVPPAWITDSVYVICVDELRPGCEQEMPMRGAFLVVFWLDCPIAKYGHRTSSVVNSSLFMVFGGDSFSCKVIRNI